MQKHIANTMQKANASRSLDAQPRHHRCRLSDARNRPPPRPLSSSARNLRHLPVTRPCTQSTPPCRIESTEENRGSPYLPSQLIRRQALDQDVGEECRMGLSNCFEVLPVAHHRLEAVVLRVYYITLSGQASQSRSPVSGYRRNVASRKCRFTKG